MQKLLFPHNACAPEEARNEIETAAARAVLPRDYVDELRCTEWEIRIANMISETHCALFGSSMPVHAYRTFAQKFRRILFPGFKS